MKKIIALLLLLPTAVMTISGAAQAQRKNTTSHDIKPKTDCVCDNTSETCPCLKKASDNAKKHHKDKKEHDAKNKKTYFGKIDGWVIEQNEKIAEDYHKFIKKIHKSELDKETSAKLQKMAEDNKNTAQKHINDTAASIKKSHKDCMSATQNNHKLCQRLDRILLSED